MRNSTNKIESALQEWVSALDAVSDPIFMHDSQGKLLRANRAYATRAGIRVNNLLGKSYWEVFPKSSGPLLNHRVVTSKATNWQQQIQTDDGDTYLVRSYDVHDDRYRCCNSIHILENVTRRLLTESNLEKVARAYKLLSTCNGILIRAEDESELLEEVCRQIVEIGGYRMACVWMPVENGSSRMVPVAKFGEEAGLFENAVVFLGNNESRGDPSAIALRTGVCQVIQNCATDPGFARWYARSQLCQCKSTVSLPLRSSAGTMGALAVFSGELNAFTSEAIASLEELADDLAFGIVTLRTRIEQRIYEEKLRNSLEQSIQAFASILEHRDPYTASHQRRVSNLCVAIAQELGLALDTILGLRLAATIHDLGKIQIPAEILSKPGKLNQFEFELIKMHPKIGHDIIKDIAFPWPIAQIVYQHHERINGTGYPLRIMGDSMLIESRILSVADVVEAISSHRPYRPALGRQFALEEINRHRGILFDPKVVDVCTTLIQRDDAILR